MTENNLKKTFTIFELYQYSVLRAMCQYAFKGTLRLVKSIRKYALPNTVRYLLQRFDT